MLNRKPTTIEKTKRKSAWRDSRGAVMVEYAFLLTFIAIPIVIGFTVSGARLLAGYVSERNFVLRPTP
jgi:Flp pilus assembly pilin Flp